MTDNDPVVFDPFSREYFNDPYPSYARLRGQCPIFYSEKHDFFALSRYEDVAAALRNWQTFSSSRGVDLQTIKSGLRNRPSMIALDPPAQLRQRALVGRLFTPRAVSVLEPIIRETIEEYASRIANEFDAVEDFATPLSFEVISRIFGVPQEFRSKLRATLERIVERGGVSGISPEEMEDSIDVGAILLGVIEERRNVPAADLITGLVQAVAEDADGRQTRLDDAEIVNFIMLVGTAGAETVAKLISNAVVLFSSHQEQWKLLRRNNGLFSSAVEEVLRYNPPASYAARYSIRDFSAHGGTIPKGNAVLLLIGSATRDEAAYPDPDRFDITRPPRLNLGFGLGIHSCLGSAVARMEGRIALEALLDHMPEFEVDEAGLRRVESPNMLGYGKVPVRALRHRRR